MDRIGKKLVWDDWNKNHIKKHDVTISEVEEVFKTYTLQKQSYAKRLELYGETKSGRKLTIIVASTRFNKPYVVSARDMSSKERVYYELQTKAN
ncbi:hypothetical protein A2773_06215 [Candidatus Gottesmanbacteria bacterium RIFCSPHIGHO2_01_FULL_39_10]|uniref:Toxin n=1 Tax=Candidatus Gottesmanbacteria bacterium RIFCSPHIGHO2_01_FULL_39_10 TaxID=1798375 RepID=A0A1F5ZMC2_9BACT|nr:MAG: hypothetical protein A2773_06215 [Candidatus Gottesmanbacteria bacterium RIFCSPHIGHO2_01_FULL_39_10]